MHARTSRTPPRKPSMYSLPLPSTSRNHHPPTAARLGAIVAAAVLAAFLIHARSSPADTDLSAAIHAGATIPLVAPPGAPSSSFSSDALSAHGIDDMDTPTIPEGLDSNQRSENPDLTTQDHTSSAAAIDPNTYTVSSDSDASAATLASIDSDHPASESEKDTTLSTVDVADMEPKDNPPSTANKVVSDPAGDYASGGHDVNSDHVPASEARIDHSEVSPGGGNKDVGAQELSNSDKFADSTTPEKSVTTDDHLSDANRQTIAATEESKESSVKSAEDDDGRSPALAIANTSDKTISGTTIGNDDISNSERSDSSVGGQQQTVTEDNDTTQLGQRSGIVSHDTTTDSEEMPAAGIAQNDAAQLGQSSGFVSRNVANPVHESTAMADGKSGMNPSGSRKTRVASGDDTIESSNKRASAPSLQFATDDKGMATGLMGSRSEVTSAKGDSTEFPAGGKQVVRSETIDSSGDKHEAATGEKKTVGNVNGGSVVGGVEREVDADSPTGQAGGAADGNDMDGVIDSGSKSDAKDKNDVPDAGESTTDMSETATKVAGAGTVGTGTDLKSTVHTDEADDGDSVSGRKSTAMNERTGIADEVAAAVSETKQNSDGKGKATAVVSESKVIADKQDGDDDISGAVSTATGSLDSNISNSKEVHA